MSDINVSWQNILNEAITKPGTIHEAYTRFHNYSIGNQMLALLARASLTPGRLSQA